MIDISRVRQLNNIALPKEPGVVVYWMKRDFRSQDNWGILFAQDMAIKHEVPMIVICEIVHNYLPVKARIQDFLIKGLMMLEEELAQYNIPFLAFESNSEKNLIEFINNYNIYSLVTDFSPLKSDIQSIQTVLSQVRIPFFEVDTHNIIPCWVTSSKQEYGAHTIRPKINNLLSKYLTDFPQLVVHPYSLADDSPSPNWSSFQNNSFDNQFINNKYFPVPGSKSALTVMNNFIENKLNGYSKYHNNPLLDFQSNLSPFLHFGHISSQRVAYEVAKIDADKDSKIVFLDELIVRKELADNFCYYSSDYQDISSFPDWAINSLNSHTFDKREYLYQLHIFESAKTHDDLWNAAQNEMVKTGRMSSYLRMYWAKKILEWTPSAREALQIAISLNDKYSLDGCDPNGYTGIAWSIGGLHDRPWFDRPIFGQVRYMSHDGCSSKFDVQKYIKKINDIQM